MHNYAIVMTKFEAIKRFWGGCIASLSLRLPITTRASWMANNAIPDSMIMNVMCRSLGPPVEFNNDPNVCSTEVALTSKNTLRILNTIKPVTRAFTAMDAVNAVRTSVFPQVWVESTSSSIIAPFAANQVASGNKLKSAYQTKIYSLTYVCNCQE